MKIFTSIFFRWPHSAIERPLYILRQDSLKCKLKTKKSMEFSWATIYLRDFPSNERGSALNKNYLTCQSRQGVKMSDPGAYKADLYCILFCFVLICSFSQLSLATSEPLNSKYFFPLYIFSFNSVCFFPPFILLWRKRSKEHQLNYLNCSTGL